MVLMRNILFEVKVEKIFGVRKREEGGQRKDSRANWTEASTGST